MKKVDGRITLTNGSGYNGMGLINSSIWQGVCAVYAGTG